MKVVILCGGKGYRLQEETEYRPKPLVPIGGRPILWHIMKMYEHYGFRDFVLCLGYKGYMIKDYFANYDLMNGDITVKLGAKQIHYENGHSEHDYRITLAETGLDTLTGGRIKRIEKYIDEDIFMATYGDGVADIDLGELLDYHMAHGKIATLTTVHPVSRWGVLEMDSQNMVRKFMEKPIEGDWINAGFFVFNRKMFDYLGDDKCVLEDSPLRRLAADGELVAFKHEGLFKVMDTYRDYIQLNEMWDKGEAQWLKQSGIPVSR